MLTSPLVASNEEPLSGSSPSSDLPVAFPAGSSSIQMLNKLMGCPKLVHLEDGRQTDKGEENLTVGACWATRECQCAASLRGPLGGFRCHEFW